MSCCNEFAHIDDDECRGFQTAVELAGRKWNSAVLMAGARGARRFSEYRTLVNGISDRMLTARLHPLVQRSMARNAVTGSGT